MACEDFVADMTWILSDNYCIILWDKLLPCEELFYLLLLESNRRIYGYVILN